MIRLPILTAMLALVVATHRLPADGKPGNGPLTADSLKSTLDDMGLKPKELAKGLYEVEINRDDYRVWARASVSRDGRLVYLTTRGAEIMRPAEMPGLFWKRLVTGNDASSPSQLYWSYVKDTRQLELTRYVPNRGLTAAALRKQLYEFHTAVKKNKDVWAEKEPAFVAIKDSAADKKARAALKGKWRSTEVINAGQTLTVEQIRNQTKRDAVEVVFDNDGGMIKLVTDDSFHSRMGPSAGLMAFYAKDTKRLVLVRYKLDRDTLTLCMDHTGLSFPVSLESTSANRHLVLKLKRVGE